jgi:hypothetical protein
MKGSVINWLYGYFVSWFTTGRSHESKENYFNNKRGNGDLGLRRKAEDEGNLDG